MVLTMPTLRVQSQYRLFTKLNDSCRSLQTRRFCDSNSKASLLRSLRIFLLYNFDTALTQNSWFYHLCKHSPNCVISLNSFFLSKILTSYKNHQLTITGNSSRNGNVIFLTSLLSVHYYSVIQTNYIQKYSFFI